MRLPACRLSVVLGGWLLCVLPGCAPAAHKHPRAEGSLPTRSASDPASQAEDPRPLSEPTPAEIAEEAYGRELPWAGLIESVQRDLGRASDLYSQGRLEEGRQTLRGCLERLRGSEFDFATHPQLERTYNGVLARLSELELEVLARRADSSLAAELDSSAGEASPLDEIADLNLFTIEIDPQLAGRLHAELVEARFDLPVVLNDQVMRAINFYQKRGRNSMEKGLARVGRFRRLFEEAFEEAGLPLDLIYMAHVESLFNPRAYSRAHARGLWQFTAGTARLYGMDIDWWIDERSDIAKSTSAAARYLKELYQKFGDWYLVMAAYNGGPGRVERILKRRGRMDFWEMSRRRLVPRETRNFVPAILASIIIFNAPERFGFQVEPEPPLSFDEFPLQFQVDLHTVARLAEVSPAEIAALNPELRRGLTPYERKDYRLKVPEGLGEKLSRQLAALPPQERIRLVHHRVRSGETLSGIAGRYGTSITAIAQVNRLRNVHRIALNQDLMIPLAGAAPGPRPSRSASSSRAVPRNGHHVVRRGDSLYRISRLYGVRLQSLLRWNNLSRSSTIYPGQQIRIATPKD